jgi:1,4-alpha-glucan branching enzyme
MQESKGPDSETQARHPHTGSAINILSGKNSPGIGHLHAMNTIFGRSATNPYSARNNIKPINFHCAAPSAQSVYLVGDFNGWNETSHPMHRRVDGWWFIEVQLRHGHHRYRFLVDDQPVLDPQATGIARDEFGERVSLLAVS